MRKKLFVFLFTVGTFVALMVPAMAGSVFEVNVISCGATGAHDGCGSNPPAADPLIRGKVEVDEHGEVEVVLKGAAANTTYRVFVGNWVTSSGFQVQFVGPDSSCGTPSIGTVTTDVNGNFSGPVVSTSTGAEFVFPPGTRIGQPNFAFNNSNTSPCRTQFTTGLAIAVTAEFENEEND